MTVVPQSAAQERRLVLVLAGIQFCHIVDFMILFGTLAAFVLLFLILARLIPVVSMHEVRELLEEERQ